MKNGLSFQTFRPVFLAYLFWGFFGDLFVCLFVGYLKFNFQGYFFVFQLFFLKQQLVLDSQIRYVLSAF